MTRPKRALTTSRTLWLGFGALTLLVVLAVLSITVRLQSVEGQLDQLLETRARATAARELEINALDYVLSVRQYLDTNGPQALSAVADHAASVDRPIVEYQRLARTERQRGFATRVNQMWTECQALAQSILDSAQQRPNEATLGQFDDARLRLETFVEDVVKREGENDYIARQQSAQQTVRTVRLFALITLFGGAILATVTSVAVGRRIVKTQREVWKKSELLRITLERIRVLTRPAA